MSTFRRRNISDDDSDDKPQRSYRDTSTAKSTSFYSRGGYNSRETNDRDRYDLGVSGSKYGSYRERDSKFNSDSDDDNRPSYRRKEDDDYRTSSSRYGTTNSNSNSSSSARRPAVHRSDDSDDDNKYGSGRRTNAFSSRPASSFQRKDSYDMDSYDSANVK